jgi:hypothetical protein
MNRRLSEHRIRATCRDLLNKSGRVSGRRLCAELRERFGAVGKTERVFQIWREEVGATASAEPVAPAAEVPVAKELVEIAELQRQLVAAETAAAENLARAERAELREQAHQDKWALEIDGLRQELLARKSNAAEVRALSDRVLQLSRELMAARSGPAE